MEGAPMATLHESFGAQALNGPQVTACVCRGAERRLLTYSEVHERSLVLAAGLVQRCVSTSRSTLAIAVSRVHVDFLPLILAASHSGLPFVLLSTDLPEKVLEEERNALAVQLLKPVICVAESLHYNIGNCNVSVVSVDELAYGVKASIGREWYAYVQGPTPPFCFMFTGGTLRTKIVQATHAMILHERIAYRDVWQPRQPSLAVVLAHTSVYWGASALGQLSIALAYGGTVVWSEAREVADLQRCIKEERITVLGLVPDQLDLLSPEDPRQDLPEIECVFTWGERLPWRVAERWRGHQNAVLRELLIATEYWLCLYADPLRDGVLRSVQNTDMLVLTDDGSRASVGEVGELYIAGPMIMAGYVAANGAETSQDVFHVCPSADSGCTSGGLQFFRTNDLVRRVENGIVYKGRADMMAKYKGQWVDMISIEESIIHTNSVIAAKVVPDTVQEHFHVFVALDAKHSADPGFALDAIRTLLPPHMQLWVLPQLPRHPVTRKVDTRRLVAMLPKTPHSWPLHELTSTLGHGEPVVPTLLRERLSDSILRHVVWTYLAVGATWAFANPDGLGMNVTLWITGLCVSAALVEGTHKSSNRNGFQHVNSRGILLRGLSIAWLASIPTLTSSFTRFIRCASSCAIFSYLWLALIYAEDASLFGESRVAKFVMTIQNALPLGKLGVFIALTSGFHKLPWYFSSICQVSLLSCGSVGCFIAARRGRLFSWPISFWTLCIGTQLEFECSKWLHARTWSQYFAWVSSMLVTPAIRWASCSSSVENVAANEPEIVTTTNVASTHLKAFDEVQCHSCFTRLDAAIWLAHDSDGNSLCDACGGIMAGTAEADADKWLATLSASDCVVAPSAPQNCQGLENSDDYNQIYAAETMAKRHCAESVADARVDDRFVCQNLTAPLAGQRWSLPAESGFGKSWAAPELPEASSCSREQSAFETWWWFNHKTDVFSIDVDERDAEPDPSPCANVASTVETSSEARLICSVVGEVQAALKPVHMGTLLVGLDSLRVMRLASTLKLRLGKTLAVSRLREAKTVAELVAAVAEKDELVHESTVLQSSPDLDREYAMWFSPGQFGPMGNWVLRADASLDVVVLRSAVEQLAARHPALRCQVVDPVRYTSLLWDASTKWTLYAPLVKTYGYGTLDLVLKIVSWSLTQVMPRARCFSVSAASDLGPDFEVCQIEHGQKEYEHMLMLQRRDLKKPCSILVCRMICHLQDVWAIDTTHYRLQFVVMSMPQSLFGECASGCRSSARKPLPTSDLIYVDAASGEWGPLLSSLDDGWVSPPYGFAALFFVPLSTGAVLWLRLHGADELRICYHENILRSSRQHHFKAFRAAPRRPNRARGPSTVVNFVSVCMLHTFADGGCFHSLVQDLIALYEALQRDARVPPAPAGHPLEELERRMFATLRGLTMPSRASLRGSLFGYHRPGYSHSLNIEPGAVVALSRAASRYRVPIDIVVLALVVCGIARADATDSVELTMYVPMRDGAAEGTMTGLFADWRDLVVSVDFQLATVIGTALQLSHIVQHRHWAVFNALRKAECTVVNMIPFDTETGTYFHHDGEHLWDVGDRLGGERETRSSRNDYVRQALSLNIKQLDEKEWWIHVSAGLDERPPEWMRRFVVAFRIALFAFIYDPLVRVHAPARDEQPALCVAESGLV